MFQEMGMGYCQAKSDGILKSRKCILFVIPTKAGIQCSQEVANSWTPFFNGVTTFYEIIKSGVSALLKGDKAP